MERLTAKHWRNLDPWECCGQDNYCQRGCHDQGGCANGCVVPKIYCRLAAYEDTGFTPEAIALFPYRKEFSYADYMKELFPKTERAEELSAADKDGRLVVLPCPLGTTVYILTAVVSRGYPDPIIETVIREETFSYQHIGMSPRYLFLTYAEAEAALKKRKEE